MLASAAASCRRAFAPAAISTTAAAEFIPASRRAASHKTPRLRVAELLSHPPTSPGASVGVAGFVRTIRKQKNIAFASLQDGSSIAAAQVVLRPEHAAALSTGSAVIVHGRWLESPSGKGQACELHADEVFPQGDNDATTNPIQKKYQTAEFLRTLPHLRVRTTQNALLLRLRSQVIASATTYFNEGGFIQAHTPIITSSDCEGAGEVFIVDANHAKHEEASAANEDTGPFFGAPKYLTVSSQLHLEALAQSVGKVWTLSPTFRAEKSDTARHLSEFYMLEAEVAFTERLDDVMDLVEDLLRNITQSLEQSAVGKDLRAFSELAVEKNRDEAASLDNVSLSKRWDSLKMPNWPRVKYHEACSTLRRMQARGDITFQTLPDDSTGLQTEHERFLADVVFNGPVFVTDYPKAIKPFYMANSADATHDIATVSCFDLLLPEVCEVVGGSIREHGLEPLKEQMRQGGLLKSSVAGEEEHGHLDWYLDLRRYGSVPHGGFGLGFDRLLAFLSGVSNVRDTVTFPRYFKRCLA